jgi:hypothetical protein
MMLDAEEREAVSDELRYEASRLLLPIPPMNDEAKWGCRTRGKLATIVYAPEGMMPDSAYQRSKEHSSVDFPDFFDCRAKSRLDFRCCWKFSDNARILLFDAFLSACRKRRRTA